MKVLVGNTSSRRLLLRLRDLRWGRMWSPGRTPARFYPDEPVGIDNGAFGCWKKGQTFDEGAFLAHVAASEQSIGTPLLAVLPDVVGGVQPRWTTPCRGSDGFPVRGPGISRCRTG